MLVNKTQAAPANGGQSSTAKSRPQRTAKRDFGKLISTGGPSASTRPTLVSSTRSPIVASRETVQVPTFLRQGSQDRYYPGSLVS